MLRACASSRNMRPMRGGRLLQPRSSVAEETASELARAASPDLDYHGACVQKVVQTGVSPQAPRYSSMASGASAQAQPELSP
jgi:hypothetical protein